MVVSQDDLSFRRVINTPKRNMGRRRMTYLEEYAQNNQCTLYTALKRTVDDDIFKGTKARSFIGLIEDFSNGYEDMPVSDLLSAVLNESGYEKMLRTEGNQERLDNLAELKQSVLEYETTCGEEATVFHYLAHVALFTNNDIEDNSNKVKLMTVHAAKGLEFPYVMLCGMDEGIFPSRKTKDLLGMEEERRLAFVAMTRAEKGLYLSGAEGRNFDGTPRYPSRFVLDIDENLLEYAEKPSDSLIADAKEYIAFNEKYMPENLESELLPVGAKVRHEYLGDGQILDINADKRAYLVKFDSVKTARLISFKVKLEQI